MKTIGWLILENVAIMALAVLLFMYTDSLWSFLLLLLCNEVETTRKIGD